MPLNSYNTIQYQSHTEPVFTGGETITEDKWHQPWSEPVRHKIKPVLAIALIASGLFFSPQQAGETITPDKWFAHLSLPVRVKPGLLASEQQFFATDYKTIVASKIPAWFAPLSEPVRQKIGLRAEFQQVDSLPTPTIPVVARLIQWFTPLSEPVRLPIGLKAWLQQFLSYHPRILPNPNVTAVMAATETNKDVALFGVQVYNAITPVTTGTSANVSISEIQAKNSANLSIKET